MVPEGSATVLVKLEIGNPTGSYKDRMARSMIEGAESRGDLKPGQTVVEYTGGSTGTSLAMVCAVKGYPLRIVTADVFAQEKLRSMRALGAELQVEPGHGGGITKDLVERMLSEVRRIVKEDGCFWTNQLTNQDVLLGYEGLGRELMEQAGQPIDVFCAAVGTAGMIMGVTRSLRAAGQQTRIVAFEPASSPVLTEGRSGSHTIDGVGIGLRPPLYDGSLVFEERAIEEQLARETARRLAREEGIFAGTSSGMNVAGAIEIAQKLGPGHTVATVCCDTGLKYLDGDLY
jgi:cysteine synthase